MASKKRGSGIRIRLPETAPAQAQGPRKASGHAGGKRGGAMPDAERQLGRSRRVH